MKIRFLTLKNFLLATFAGLIGINLGCAKIGGLDGGEHMEAMYGCPITDYYIHGTVHDASGNAIEGIEVGLDCGFIEDGVRYLSPTDTTGVDGEYGWTAYTSQGNIVVRDIDGSAHGAWKDTIIQFDIQQGGPGATVDVPLDIEL